MLTPWRYEILLNYADQVDSTGRFRSFLVLLRWLGRRVSTVRRFTRSTLLQSEAEIRTALNVQLCQYVEEYDCDRVARLYASAGGAVFIRWSYEKTAQSGDADKVEQYDAVQPVPPIVMEEANRYFPKFWNRLGLTADAPLLPGDDLGKPISAETVNKWFHRAELLAAKDGKSLEMSSGNAYHGLRYNRRTEFRKAELK